MMKNSIQNYCLELLTQFDAIPNDRKVLLEKLSDYINNKIKVDQEVNLIYICTHNSRRSHFGQVWSQVAAAYFGIKQVKTFSGGTEATAFNTNAINALVRIGFEVIKTDDSANPVYKVIYDELAQPIICFSKIYNHPNNPSSNFAAIMTCGEAEENCPFIPEVELRIATTYSDPKAFDNTQQQDMKYDERCHQIALETFYVFSMIDKN